MRLLVVRHAIAFDREEWQGADDERPLTDEGRKKMKRVARGLTRLVERLDLLGASPLVRAQQTAGIVAAAYGDLRITTVPALAPGEPPKALAHWLLGLRHDTVAVVGHEPHLSGTVAWLLTGTERHVLELKKGGACLLDVPGEVVPGRATLLWALWPGQLRDLGD